MNFIEFIQNNLLHVLPILISGVFAVAIIFERSKALIKTYPLQNSIVFFQQLKNDLMHGKVKNALSLCEQYGDKPITRLIKTGLLRAHLPEDSIEQALMMSLGDETRKIQKRTSFLATIANVATLLGLLGTIAGLIHSFEAVSLADPQQKAAMLSAGIATAMNATMLGLGVAIPCMVAFSFLMNKANRLVAELENGAIKTLDILKQRFYIDEVEHSERSSTDAPKRPLKSVA